jgi:arsenite methyltransferase
MKNGQPALDGSASLRPHISSGVIDLVSDKEAVDRVLRPGVRLQLADVVIYTEVSADARQRIDLWTG